MDGHELRSAFEEVFDQALVFHGFTDYLRDYDLYLCVTADPRTGIAPAYLRYRFTHCVRATVETAVAPDVWQRSLDDAFTDYDVWLSRGEPEGYVWGVKWACLYPGMSLLTDNDETRAWSARLGRPVRQVRVETNGHTIDLVFADLMIATLAPAETPFAVPGRDSPTTS